MWNNILKIDKLQTGDVIETSSPALFFKHYGVIFYKNGIPYVAHNIPKTGPIIETLEQLEKKRTIYNYFRNEITKKLTDKFIEDKTNELSAYGFNFMEMNCEDFVKRVVGTYIGFDDRVTAIIIISSIIIVALIVTLTIVIKRK